MSGALHAGRAAPSVPRVRRADTTRFVTRPGYGRGAVKLMLLLLGLAACPGPTGPRPPDNQPKLVVLLVVDQWPEWAFEHKRPAFHEGFARLLAEGEWHIGHYASAATLTAPGHALLGTGEPSARSGILSNQWWHRDSGVALKAVEAEDGSVTTKWLRITALGDWIAAAHTGAKAVAVALKDRAAILPLGHAGLPIRYDVKTAAWTTLGTRPAWLGELDRDHPVTARAREVWTPIDPAQIAQLSGIADDAPGEVGEKGFGPTFPHDPATTKAPDEAFFAMPLGNELVLDTAIAALHGEALGTDATPDLLIVSLSAHDYVGHGWGHESWEMWDTELRLDQQLGTFLAELDRSVGAGKWAMIVTSDHGASPMPETLAGGRMTHEEIQTAANHAASAVLGPGHWIDNAHYPNVYFSKAMLAQPREELDSATKRVINALRSFPGIERVGRVADYVGHCETRTGEALALCMTFDAERSGDLFFLPAKGWIMEDEGEPTATSHGSWHDYDQQVPVIMLAPGRTPHVAATAPIGEVQMVGIAPILAGWLGVTPARAR
jgi:hypothetical protein